MLTLQKMASINYVKRGSVFQCRLKLDDGSDVVIPLREDGYIYATALCKAAGRRLSNWVRLADTQKIKEKLEDKLKKTMRVNEHPPKVIDIRMGSKDGLDQGTWVHPDLGIVLAQWCSPSFALQVGSWIKELVFTGEVKAGSEKTETEVTESLKAKLREAEEKLAAAKAESAAKDAELGKTKAKLKRTEEVAAGFEKHNKEVEAQLKQVRINHQTFLRRKDLYKMRTGTCVYLADVDGLNDRRVETIERIKVGYTGDINRRMADFRTGSPFIKLMCVIYTPSHLSLENAMKVKFEKNLFPNNREFITGVPFREIKRVLLAMVEMLEIDHSVATDDELKKFNENTIPKYEEEMKIVIPEGKQRCGGAHHETEESRLLTFDNFFKNKGNASGYNRLCKRCYMLGRSGDNYKQRKVVAVPVYDALTHKWCNRCETVKVHDDFYRASDTKDGLNPNCKDCKADQKRQQQSDSKSNVETLSK